MNGAAGTRPGLVVAGYGRQWLVESDDGTRTLCHPRGKKSEAVVGDRVAWQPTGDEGVIERIEPRRNLLFRQDEYRTKSFAANIDGILVMVAGEPMFNEWLLGRALVAAHAAGIDVKVLLNKADLPQAADARQRLAPLQAFGTTVIELSLKTRADEARTLLAPLLAGRTQLLLGPSGMGKSTLINLMVPDAQAQVGEISMALNAGRHTTTRTTLYWLDAQRTGAVIDSPGFQGFGLHHIAPDQLPGLMPDIGALADGCRFYNCSHLHEPGCAVRAAADAGTVDAGRYRFYVAMREELARS